MTNMQSTEFRLPVPDPTELTTQQLKREVHGVRELFEAKLIALTALTEEKFKSVGMQFSERDQRNNQRIMDSNAAVAAALQCAKEAVEKSELMTIKQIDQQGTLIATATKALEERIGDMKDRLVLIEGTSVGGHETKAAMNATTGTIISVVAGVIAAIGVVVLIISTILTHIHQ